MDRPDEVMASAGAALERRAQDRQGVQDGRGRSPAVRRDARRLRAYSRRLKVAGAAAGAVLVAMIGLGMVAPLGMFGALFFLLLLVALPAAILALWPGEPPAPAPEQLRSADLKALPAQTGRWLAAQRPALPAPAVTLVDHIGLRLRALEPQLAGLDAGTPAGEDARKLMAEQLPEFVRGYQRVPESLRAVPRNGRTPDAQLVDGLSLIDRQLAEMSEQLAQGDLDALATRGRFLEIKYRGDGEGDAG